MNFFTRGIRNAFRNGVRTVSIVVILGLSIGLSLTMLIAHQAISDKIASVKSSIGNTVTITPAGVQGFEGGGNPLTESQLATVKSLPHVATMTESISDRLTSDNSNLQSAIDAGALGKRFSTENSGGQGMSGFGMADGAAPFMPKIAVNALGTTDPAKLNGNDVKITSGAQINGTADQNVALIGSSLASKNNLKAGGTFTAYNTTITIAGIFDTGTAFANNQVIFPLPALQRLSGQVNDVTSATVTVDSVSNIDGVTSAIKSKLGSAADVVSSKDTVNNAVSELAGIQNVSLFSLVGAVVAGSVIILLTMIMVVRERKREIGVVKAIGGSNARIVLEFITEALTLTILGAVIGLLVGVAGGTPVTKTLVNNAASSSAPAGPGAAGMVSIKGSAPGGGFGGFGKRLDNNSAVRGLKNIKTEIGWGILLDGFGAAVLIAAIGSALAAGMIAKIRPSEAMRAE